MMYIIINKLLSKKNIIIPYILGILFYEAFFLQLEGLNLGILAIFIVTIKLSKGYCIENDLSNADKYYLTLSYRKKDVVKEKYLLFAIVLALGLLSFLVGIFINILYKGYSEIHPYNIMLVLIILPIVIVFQSIWFFMYFKKGASYSIGNSNRIYIFIFIAIMVYGQIRKKYNIEIFTTDYKFGGKESIFLAIASIFLTIIISYLISLKLYNKREL